MPNPWFTRLLCVMRELYEVKDLKLTLKFAIEVLFNDLKVQTNNIPVTHMLKPLNSNKLHRDLSKGSDSPTISAISSNDLLLPAQYIIINPSIRVFSIYPQLKTFVATAIDRAIKELLQPVVERSVNIACTAAKEIISKDFALEPDENKMRKAAHAMVQSMSGSLALVTCKEHLRTKLVKVLSNTLEVNLRQLQNARAINLQQVEAAASQITNDNITLCCAVIENAASERAIRSIDDVLAPLYKSRQQHRAATPNIPYIDMNFLNSKKGIYTLSLPVVLRTTR